MNDRQSLHILLVEDDHGDARLLQENLRDVKEGKFTYTCVSTVNEVLDQLQNAQFDVMLLDLNLPDNQGLDTFLKVQSPARMTPILILTGQDDQSLALQAVKAGAQDYIVKGQMVGSLLARAILYAIERHRLQTEIHNLSMQDSLTGLYNRRGFLMLAEEQLKLVHRSQQGLLLFLCDLDGMKPINDTFGHIEGDGALIATAAILRGTFRDSDIIARLSGDEFVILAVGSLPASAERLQARLQANLNKHNAQSGHPYELSFSTGVAYAGTEGQPTVDELISKADQEMYAHKRARRKARSD